MRVLKLVIFMIVCMPIAALAEYPPLQPLIDAAAKNEILIPPPGIYSGPVYVEQSLTIDGRGQVTIDAGGKGSVVYIDTDGATQTVSSSVYDVDIDQEPGRLRLAYSESWPSDRRSTPNSVIIRFVAGYGDADAVPETIKAAIKLLVGHLYEHRVQTILADVAELQSRPSTRGATERSQRHRARTPPSLAPRRSGRPSWLRRRAPSPA